MSQKLDAISFLEQGIGSDMVFMIMGVNYRFYSFAFQELCQLLGGMSRSAIYQEAVHQVDGYNAARIVRIAAQFNLGNLFVIGSSQHVLILSEEGQHFFYRSGIEYIFSLAPAAASYTDTEAHKAQVSHAVGVRAHD